MLDSEYQYEIINICDLDTPAETEVRLRSDHLAILAEDFFSKAGFQRLLELGWIRLSKEYEAGENSDLKLYVYLQKEFVFLGEPNRVFWEYIDDYAGGRFFMGNYREGTVMFDGSDYNERTLDPGFKDWLRDYVLEHPDL